jgi:cystathionine beta-lyase/cystathionine gamma-synthase
VWRAIKGTKHLIDRAWEYLRVHGPVLHPFEAWLLRCGLQAYRLRVAAHNSNALAVAQFLEQHPAVERVYYPGLESHLQYELAKQQMPGGFGGMLSFEMKGGYEAAYKVSSSTELCLLAVSLGGGETLITHPASMSHAHRTDEEHRAAGISPGLIRLSVGGENLEDIIEDLEQALGLINPVYLQDRRPGQRLHHDTILFSFLAQGVQLLRRGFRGINIKGHTDLLKPNGHLL